MYTVSYVCSLKPKENFLEKIMCSEMGKQNGQPKKDYSRGTALLLVFPLIKSILTAVKYNIISASPYLKYVYFPLSGKALTCTDNLRRS